MEHISELRSAIAALTPGLVILFVRSRFVRGRRQDLKDAVLGYLVVSAIYFAAATPTIAWLVRAGRLSAFLGPPVETVLLPTALGLLLGAAAQGGWGSVLRHVGLRPLHPTTSAWDWAFVRTRRPRYVLVTLTGGEQVAGLYARESFAGSEEADRDLYLQSTYDISPDGRWAPRAEPYSVLIRGSEIRLIELTEGPSP